MDFEVGAYFDDDTPPVSPHCSGEGPITDADINKWASWVKPFPLPHYLAPTEPQYFEEVSDEVLLSAPPHLIVHLHRTAAQGGLQVISPRQTPMSSLMARVKDPHRALGDHVVGSIATPNAKWPTLDNEDVSDLLPDEPLCICRDDLTTRTKTRTEPLTKAPALMKDPILSCLVKGRAVIDLQQRDDVMGDADGMTSLLASAWGVSPGEIMDMDAFTLAIEGPLLRHSIKADEVFPMVHAPIHQKMSVSVGTTEATRDLLPMDSAIDWRRLRVFCEAIFLMTCAVEGIPLSAIRCMPPPGDPAAPLTRPGVLAFRPRACVAWSHEPKSFSVFPSKIPRPERLGEIPREVMSALSRYVQAVRPMSAAMSAGHRAKAKKTSLQQGITPLGETISGSYNALVKTVQLGGGRGKTAVRAVRNLIYEALDQAPSHTRLRLSRYMRIAKSECKIHLGTDVVPDMLIDRLASKFLKIGELIRTKIVGECARRGSTAEEWWDDFVSQAPHSYQMMNEGTMGWAKVAMWLMFKAPTEKWTNLEKVVHFSALRSVEMGTMESVPLPPVKGSMERLLAASQALVRNMTTAYSGYYMAVCDVAMSISDVLDSMNRHRSAATVREGAFLWCLRARALRGTNVHAIDKGRPTPSMNHLRVFTEPVDILVVPAPYRPFAAYQSHVRTSEVLHKRAVAEIVRYNSPKISDLFLQLQAPIATTKDSISTRYLLDPNRLGEDMEKSWRELTSDVRRVVDIYGHGGTEMSRQKRPAEEKLIDMEVFDMAPIIKRTKQPGISYYELIGMADLDEVEWIEDVLMGMDETVAAELQERTYKDMDELRILLRLAERDVVTSAPGTGETVL